MIAEHRHQLARAGVRHDSSRPEESADDEDVGAVHEQLCDLRDAHPPGLLEIPPDRRPRRLVGRGVPQGRMSPRDPDGASRRRGQLHRRRTGHQSPQAPSGGHKRDGQRRRRRPARQLNLAEEPQVLEPLQQALIQANREQRHVSRQNECQRPAQPRPRFRHRPQRHDRRTRDQRHLPAGDASHPPEQDHQFCGAVVSCPASGVGDFAWKQRSDADVEQRDVAQDLGGEHPQSEIPLTDMGQEERRQPEPHKCDQHHVEVAEADSVEESPPARHACRRRTASP